MKLYEYLLMMLVVAAEFGKHHRGLHDLLDIGTVLMQCVKVWLRTARVIVDCHHVESGRD